ncbi:hypothetical protein GQ53DRAFT_263573 [Thozetella sp. PMI_491]|nr:hypothetical protein GQ53DRAFT_263573 [Thozetella sp. PMI_491]
MPRDDSLVARPVGAAAEGRPRLLPRVSRENSGVSSLCQEGMADCERFGMPNVCCPAGMSCFSSRDTPSRIYCCGPPSYAENWHGSSSNAEVPSCPVDHHACASSEGGRCCLHNTTCTTGGCVKVLAAAAGFESRWLSDGVDERLEGTARNKSLMPQLPGNRAAEVTLVKTGEVAQMCGAERAARQQGCIGALALSTLTSIVLAVAF